MYFICDPEPNLITPRLLLLDLFALCILGGFCLDFVCRLEGSKQDQGQLHRIRRIHNK
jgi:hypothetical protein